MTSLLVLPALAFAVVFVLIALMLKKRWFWAVDQPNHRSLHSDPTPRTGGLAIMLAIVTAATISRVYFQFVPMAALALAAVLAAISLADDRGGLPITVRLGSHLTAAGIFAAYLTDNAAPWWWMAGAVLAIAAMTNFYNFMDGANGLAGGMAVAGFGCYGLASMAAAPGFAVTCFIIAAAAAGFLRFNIGGRIFLGDGGSVPLGFLAAALGLEGWVRGLWPIWFGLLTFAPFVTDATITLVRRVARGERFWHAHREHYYQRLVRSGWTHGRLAGVEYALMVACGATALAARNGGATTKIIAFATIILLLTAAATAIDVRWRRFVAAQQSSG